MQCSPAPWAPLPEGALLVRAQAFASDAANALAVGDDATGKTTVYRLSQAMVTPVATKVVHLGARAIVSPLGSVVVFGGAGEIESFVP